MWFPSWLRNRKRHGYPRKRPIFRPTLETLEARWVPSTLTVSNLLDSGAGSLRADIAAAHNGDTIVFAPSLNGQTITLTSGELLINQDLTIAGPGAGELTISGGGHSRVFEVATGTNSVTLSGLTISNGVAHSGTQVSDLGGGILNHGTLTVSASTLSGNSAYLEGGAIYNDGTLTVSGSTLSSNSAHSGGAIYDIGGTLTVSGSTLSSNSAHAGGAIYFLNGKLTVSNSILSGNSTGNYGVGGAIDNIGGTVTVSGSTLSGNSAWRGGGIYTSGSFATVTVGGSILSGNSASYAGGGIYNDLANGGRGQQSTVTVENSSKITGNTAPAGYGPDVYNLGWLYLDGSSTLGILDGNPAKPI